MSTEQLTVPLGALCSLLMCSDPWPVDDQGEGDGRDALVAFADRVAQQAGFGGWIDAYHDTGNAYAAPLRQQAARVDEDAVTRACNAYFDALPVTGGEAANRDAMRAALSAQPAPDAEVERGLAFRSGARWADANQDSGGEPRVLQLCREANSYAASPYRWDKWPQPAPERQGEVAEVYRVPEDWGRYEAHLAVRLVTGAQAKEGDKLYTHPAAPVCVPDPMIVPYGSESGEKDYAYGYEKGRADGWNACRRLALDAATPAPVGVPDGMVRLWDTQWMNIVNHDNCYRGWDKADAINHAVKMTEQAIARNIADGKLPPRLIAAAPSASVGMGLPDVKAMVDRFLGWRLPESFAPDCYISFNPEPLKQWPGMWPVGTNLLDADQAEQMVRYMLAAPSAPQVDA